MRKLLLFALLLTTSCFAQDRVQDLAKAIAKAEGFYRVGTLPNRLHNPGDIRAHASHYPGQVGLYKNYVVFKNDAYGWDALEHQLSKIIDGTSRYTVNVTLEQLGKRYASSKLWARNVAHNLGVPLDTTLWEILGVAPVLEGVQCPSLNVVLQVVSTSVPTSTMAGSTA
jgi:hypothetical protein